MGGKVPSCWLSPKLTWPHPGFLELFVDEVHLVQTTLNLLDTVGRKQEDSNTTVVGDRRELAPCRRSLMTTE